MPARRPPRHDADAGGDAATLDAKAALRDEVWDALQEAGVARFPGAHGRIPNFTGAEEHPFFLLDPADLADTPRKASSIKGATRSAPTVDLADVAPVDLVVAGCVAVDATGARLGKGGGFSDLEFAVAAEAGLVSPDTVVCTTVHDRQVLDDGRIPVTDHDIRLDLIVTPTRVIEVPSARDGRAGVIRWDDLTEEKIASIPLLQRLRDGES